MPLTLPAAYRTPISERTERRRCRAVRHRHILPNVAAPVIVLVTLGIPNAIIAGAAVSVLGLGVKPPTPAIVAIAMTINLFGDGLRDALDPRLKL